MFAFYISKILAKKFKGYFFRTLYIGFDTLTFRQKFSFDDLILVPFSFLLLV